VGWRGWCYLRTKGITFLGDLFPAGAEFVGIGEVGSKLGEGFRIGEAGETLIVDFLDGAGEIRVDLEIHDAKRR